MVVANCARTSRRDVSTKSGYAREHAKMIVRINPRPTRSVRECTRESLLHLLLLTWTSRSVYEFRHILFLRLAVRPPLRTTSLEIQDLERASPYMVHSRSDAGSTYVSPSQVLCLHPLFRSKRITRERPPTIMSIVPLPAVDA